MANNQIVNFNRQDVANAYRRNQYAQALQERMNAPIPVNTFQGFQAPTSPAAGIAKALDIYSVWQNEKNQEKQYQDEKAAAEQKAQKLIDTQNEQVTEFGNKFNPVTTEKMIGGNTSFTPTQYADAINAYGNPQEPTQASDMLNGEPTTYGRNEGTLRITNTPRTREEITRLELEGAGSNNLGMNRIAQQSRESRIADETAKAIIAKAVEDRGNVTSDYSKNLADQEKINTTKNIRDVDAATIKFGRDVEMKKMEMKGKDENKKEIPAAAAKSILGNINHLNKVREAMSLMEGEKVGDSQGDANATGFWKGLLPNVALQYFDKEGVPTRAAVSDIGSMVIHDRAGTAATASETPRLKPFIPLVNDDPDVVKDKLTKFKREYESMEREAHKFYKGQGYNMGGIDEPKEAPTTNRTKKRIYNLKTDRFE